MEGPSTGCHWGWGPPSGSSCQLSPEVIPAYLSPKTIPVIECSMWTVQKLCQFTATEVHNLEISEEYSNHTSSAWHSPMVVGIWVIGFPIIFSSSSFVRHPISSTSLLIYRHLELVIFSPGYSLSLVSPAYLGHPIQVEQSSACFRSNRVATGQLFLGKALLWVEWGVQLSEQY